MKELMNVNIIKRVVNTPKTRLVVLHLKSINVLIQETNSFTHFELTLERGAAGGFNRGASGPIGWYPPVLAIQNLL